MPHEGPALIVSRWPQSGLPKDAMALQHFGDLQALVWLLMDRALLHFAAHNANDGSYM